MLKPIIFACLFAIGHLLCHAQPSSSTPLSREVAPPAYTWRGCMIDVSRHFFPISFLKRQVDILASYRINRLHLHLTDAAGWRFEMKGYPQLTQRAAWRTQSDWGRWWEAGDRQYVDEGTPGAYGGYYTVTELQDLVRYAAERGIVIVPEVEFPGHSEEVTAVLPQLKCEGNTGAQGEICPSAPDTYRFIDDVLAEVARIFPSDYIHIGGDEAAKEHWRNCPRCQKMANDLGLSSTDLLQDHIVRYAMRRVASLGRRPIGWDDALCDSLPAGTAIMIWRSPEMAEKALAKGYDVIYSPLQHCYLDYVQDAPQTQPLSFGGYLPLDKVWAMQPPKGVMGVQGNLWTEFIETPEHAEMMLYPRIMAIAEVGLKGKARGSFKSFRKRALQEVARLQSLGYSPFDLKKEAGHRPESLHRIKHKACGAKVTYNKPYSESYTAGGVSALVDGLQGDWVHTDGRWQGFMTDSCLDITIDLGKVKTVRSVSMNFLQSEEAYIFEPKMVSFSTSVDGKHFTLLSERKITRTVSKGVYVARQKSAIRPMTWDVSEKKMRYIRVQASATGVGHWIFADEIIVQ